MTDTAAADEIRHAAKLPHGYRVVFKWKDGKQVVEWDPGLPVIRSERAWRTFRNAYDAERRIFLTNVATSIGGAVLVADLDGPMEVIKPASKH